MVFSFVLSPGDPELRTADPSAMTNGVSMHTALEKKLKSTASPWERLPVLIELARESKPRHPDYPAQCAREALCLARELDDQFWIASSLRAIGVELMKKARYSEVLHYLNGASRIFARLNDPVATAHTDFHIAVTHIYLGEFDEAVRLLSRNLPLYESMRDRSWIVRAYRQLGYISRSIGDHAAGLDYYGRSLEIAVEADLRDEIALLYLYMALSYREIGDAKRHARYLFRSLATCRKLGDRAGAATAMANIASMYLERKLHARAEVYARQSGKLCRELGFTANEAMAWCQMADIYSHRGDFRNAFRCFRKGGALARRGEHKVFLGKIHDHLGVAYLNTGKPEKGLRHLLVALDILNASGYAHFHYEVHEHLSNAFEALGDHASALEHQRRFLSLKEEYLNAGKVLEAGQLEMKAQIRKLTAELKHEKKAAVMLRELAERKEAELVELTLRLVQHGNGSNGNGPIGGHGSVPARQGTDDNWETFARQFHKVHHSFYTNLIRRYPQLTPTEVKVCSLIKIGLTSKEIASLLGVSKRTVDSHREHIHKKLNISCRLAHFIASM